MAGSLEESEFTSVFDRITGKQGRAKVKKAEDRRGKERAIRSNESPEAAEEMARAREEAVADAWLCPMGEAADRHTVLDMSLDGYLALVEWTGQAMREDNRGSLPVGMRSILENLELDVDAWVETVTEFGRIFHRVAGREAKLRERARERGQRWVAGVKRGRGVYRSAAVG